MSATITLDDNGLIRIKKGFMSYIPNTGEFFTQLGVKLLQNIKLTFRSQGELYGRPKWRDYKTGTLHPKRVKHGETIGYNLKRWNIRTGTDGTRSKYSSTSKLLQASGSFMRSFMVLANDSKSVTVGTNMEHAEGIMRDRAVIPDELSDIEIGMIADQFYAFFQKNINWDTV